MQRLSSGLRINSAKDDPTGMVTAAGYDSQMRGANQATRNANDGISTAQINDGYHQHVVQNLHGLLEIGEDEPRELRASTWVGRKERGSMARARVQLHTVASDCLPRVDTPLEEQSL